MQCEQCGDKPATVHLTQVIDGDVRKLHLCEACAAESGFDIQGNISVTDILLGIDGDALLTTQPSGDLEKSCPTCHMRRSDFKKTGQFGCPDCYATFKEELSPLLKAMHRGDRHVGKVPSREGIRVRMTAEISDLETQLQEAIAAERFEDAARMRDQIKACKDKLETAKDESSP
jgi:protein arginine kinase activator